MFEIHPSAEENFNSKVYSLIKKVEAAPVQGKFVPKFETEVHVGATITDKDIIGDLQEKASDYRGNTVARFFISKGVRYGLENESHKSLVDLAEKIQRLPAFRDRLSHEFIEEIIFKWLKNSFIKNEKNKLFMSVLIEEAREAVKPVTVYVPIANMVVERPFSFCGVVICNITKSLVDEIAATGASKEEEEQKKNAETFFEKFRKDYQGYAAVEIKLHCEPNFANDLAIMTAQRVTSFLGIYSGAMLMPDIKCICKIKGTENLAQSTTISIFESKSLSVTHGILDQASMRSWHISEKDIEEYAKCGLGVLSDLAVKQKPAEFESLILNTSTLYSKAAFTAEPLEKLVYILSALESTLLKNENEPIQQNLAERLAIFTSQELAERKSIVKAVKSVYGLRSRYLHHGHTSGELEGLSEFLLHVWIFYIKLLGASQSFTNKSGFLEAIDDHKLG
ncbi:MAG: hypothetical protein ACQEXO_02540 [Pseudomonadota bacterium]